jgi:hypothetical protein
VSKGAKRRAHAELVHKKRPRITKDVDGRVKPGHDVERVARVYLSSVVPAKRAIASASRDP